MIINISSGLHVSILNNWVKNCVIVISFSNVSRSSRARNTSCFSSSRTCGGAPCSVPLLPFWYILTHSGSREHWWLYQKIVLTIKLIYQAFLLSYLEGMQYPAAPSLRISNIGCKVAYMRGHIMNMLWSIDFDSSITATYFVDTYLIIYKVFVPFFY